MRACVQRRGARREGPHTMVPPNRLDGTRAPRPPDRKSPGLLAYASPPPARADSMQPDATLRGASSLPHITST